MPNFRLRKTKFLFRQNQISCYTLFRYSALAKPMQRCCYSIFTALCKITKNNMKSQSHTKSNGEQKKRVKFLVWPTFRPIFVSIVYLFLAQLVCLFQRYAQLLLPPRCVLEQTIVVDLHECVQCVNENLQCECVRMHEMELVRRDSLSSCSFLILWNEIMNGVPSMFHFGIHRCERMNERKTTTTTIKQIMNYHSILICNSLVVCNKRIYRATRSKIDAISLFRCIGRLHNRKETIDWTCHYTGILIKNCVFIAQMSELVAQSLIASNGLSTADFNDKPKYFCIHARNALDDNTI